VHLEIREGDRVLLTGESGSGKSTLVSVIGGSRRPDAGTLLLRGLDESVIGARNWRRQVAIAPQFHENHLFAETLAFNLLLGRRWPPRSQDLDDAHSLCLELGLGDLIERMPGGLFQRVGETGWRLSHGERSRVFLARALLQRADIVVLDESLAAIDAGSHAACLRAVLDRSPTLVIVSHG
jgi:ATP-binding cassette subfamily B protein